MYKVFFKDRTVYFGDDFSKVFGKNNGLFYKYNNLEELTELIHVFHELTRINKLFIFHHDILSLFEDFKACFNYIDAAGGLVMRSDGKFLVMKRDGLWDLPKGKLETGESVESAALREVEEETGLKGLKITQPVLSTFCIMMVMKILCLRRKKTLRRYSGLMQERLTSSGRIHMPAFLMCFTSQISSRPHDFEQLLFQSFCSQGGR